MFIIDGLVRDASDEEMDAKSTESYSLDTYSINQEEYNAPPEPKAQSKPRIKCNQCGKTFNTESGWTKHMKISHRKISNKEIINLECVSCEMKFDSRNNI